MYKISPYEQQELIFECPHHKQNFIDQISIGQGVDLKHRACCRECNYIKLPRDLQFAKEEYEKYEEQERKNFSDIFKVFLEAQQTLKDDLDKLNLWIRQVNIFFEKYFDQMQDEMNKIERASLFHQLSLEKLQQFAEYLSLSQEDQTTIKEKKIQYYKEQNLKILEFSSQYSKKLNETLGQFFNYDALYGLFRTLNQLQFASDHKKQFTQQLKYQKFSESLHDNHQGLIQLQREIIVTLFQTQINQIFLSSNQVFILRKSYLEIYYFAGEELSNPYYLYLRKKVLKMAFSQDYNQFIVSHKQNLVSIWSKQMQEYGKEEQNLDFQVKGGIIDLYIYSDGQSQQQRIFIITSEFEIVIFNKNDKNWKRYLQTQIEDKSNIFYFPDCSNILAHGKKKFCILEFQNKKQQNYHIALDENETLQCISSDIFKPSYTEKNETNQILNALWYTLIDSNICIFRAVQDQRILRIYTIPIHCNFQKFLLTNNYFLFTEPANKMKQEHRCENIAFPQSLPNQKRADQYPSYVPKKNRLQIPTNEQTFQLPAINQRCNQSSINSSQIVQKEDRSEYEYQAKLKSQSRETKRSRQLPPSLKKVEMKTELLQKYENQPDNFNDLDFSKISIMQIDGDQIVDQEKKFDLGLINFLVHKNQSQYCFKYLKQTKQNKFQLVDLGNYTIK